MKKTSSKLDLILKIAKIQAMLSRRFDSGLGGLSLNEFVILLRLNQAPDQKLRRTDLAAMLGLTASGVTRILLPMEKIGLVKRQNNKDDARVSYVVLSRAGKEKLVDSLERAQYLSDETAIDLEDAEIKKIDDLISSLIWV